MVHVIIFIVLVCYYVMGTLRVTRYVSLFKVTLTVLVFLVLSDEAMEIWFDRGNGFVFTSVCEWLQGNNGQLLQSAAFALGNFARNGRSYKHISPVGR